MAEAADAPADEGVGGVDDEGAEGVEGGVDEGGDEREEGGLRGGDAFGDEEEDVRRDVDVDGVGGAAGGGGAAGALVGGEGRLDVPSSLFECAADFGDAVVVGVADVHGVEDGVGHGGHEGVDFEPVVEALVLAFVVVADFFGFDLFDFREGFAVGGGVVGVDAFFEAGFEFGVVAVFDGEVDGVAESGLAARGAEGIFEVVGLVARSATANWLGFVYHDRRLLGSAHIQYQLCSELAFNIHIC